MFSDNKRVYFRSKELFDKAIYENIEEPFNMEISEDYKYDYKKVVEDFSNKINELLDKAEYADSYEDVVINSKTIKTHKSSIVINKKDLYGDEAVGSIKIDLYTNVINAKFIKATVILDNDKIEIVNDSNVYKYDAYLNGINIKGDYQDNKLSGKIIVSVENDSVTFDYSIAKEDDVYKFKFSTTIEMVINLVIEGSFKYNSSKNSVGVDFDYNISMQMLSYMFVLKTNGNSSLSKVNNMIDMDIEDAVDINSLTNEDKENIYKKLNEILDSNILHDFEMFNNGLSLDIMNM